MPGKGRKLVTRNAKAAKIVAKWRGMPNGLSEPFKNRRNATHA
jgi:hypothetical protein